MKPTRRFEIVAALLLIGAGLAFLLGNLGLIPNLPQFLWPALILGGGVAFLAAYLAGRLHWWALIAGSAMAGVGLAGLLGQAPGLPGELAGAALFACLAAGFVGVYLVDRRQNWWALIPAAATGALAATVLLSAAARGEWGGVTLFLGLGAVFVALYFAEIDGRRHNWWALIPAGALFSLATVILLSMYATGSLAGAALFLGLGLTFGVLYLIRSPGRPLQWARIPALGLLGFGLFVLLVAGDPLVARLFWPATIILVGALLLVHNLRRRHQE